MRKKIGVLVSVLSVCASPTENKLNAISLPHFFTFFFKANFLFFLRKFTCLFRRRSSEGRGEEKENYKMIETEVGVYCVGVGVCEWYAVVSHVVSTTLIGISTRAVVLIGV